MKSLTELKKEVAAMTEQLTSLGIDVTELTQGSIATQHIKLGNAIKAQATAADEAIKNVLKSNEDKKDTKAKVSFVVKTTASQRAEMLVKAKKDFINNKQ